MSFVSLLSLYSSTIRLLNCPSWSSNFSLQARMYPEPLISCVLQLHSSKESDSHHSLHGDSKEQRSDHTCQWIEEGWSFLLIRRAFFLSSTGEVPVWSLKRENKEVIQGGNNEINWFLFLHVDSSLHETNSAVFPLVDRASLIAWGSLRVARHERTCLDRDHPRLSLSA